MSNFYPKIGFRGFLSFALVVFSLLFAEAQANLSISIRSNSPTYANYTFVTLYVTVKNNGPNVSNGVVCAFPFPANASNNCSTTSVGVWRNWETAGLWSIGTLASGDSATLQATLFTLGGSTIVAAPSVSATTSDPVTSNNSTTITLTQGAQAAYISCSTNPPTGGGGDSVDVELAISMANPEVNYNQIGSLIIGLKNNSSKKASGVKIKINLPFGLQYNAHDVAGLGVYDPITSIWDVGELTAYANRAMTLNVKTLQGGSNKVTGQVTTCIEPDIDSKPNNFNTALPPKEDDEAAFTLTGLLVDLSMTAAVAAGTPSQLRVGDTVTYICTLNNAGPTRGEGTKIRAYIPLGFTYVSSSATIGEYDASVGVWLLSHTPDPVTGNKPGFTIQPNTSQQLTLKLKTTQTGNLLFDTEVRSCNMPDFDSTPSNNVLTEDDEAQVTINISNNTDPNAADLELSLNSSKTPINSGDSLVYSVGIFNRGPANAANVTIKLNIPTPVSGNYTPSVGSYSNGTWTIGNLAANATALLSFKGTTTCLAIGSKVFAQVQTATQTDYDSPHGNDTNQIADEDDEVGLAISTNCQTPYVDLQLTSNILKTAVLSGDSIVFQLILTNVGTVNATGVTVKDSIPTALGITSITPSIGTFANKIWTIGTLNINQSVTLTCRGIATNLTTTQNNFAQVQTASPQDVDSTPGNDTNFTANEDDETLLTFVPTTTPNADLELSMTTNKTTVTNGSTLSYTLTLTNKGNSNAANVRVSDTLDIRFLNFVNASTSNGSYDAGSGYWSVGNLGVNQTATLTLNVTVSNIVTSIKNYAQVKNSSLPDPDSQVDNDLDRFPNEDDEALVEVFSQAATDSDLELSLAAPPQYSTALPLYTNVVFTCKVVNKGAAAATNVKVKYPFPAGMAYNSNITTKGAYESYTGEWIIGTVAPNETVELKLTMFTLQATTSQFAQVQTNNATDPDSTPGNDTNQTPNEDDESLLSIPSANPIKLIDLQLVMTSTKTLVTVGDIIVFTLKIDNKGDTTATNVVVKDLLPSGLTYTSHVAQQGTYTSATGLWSVGTLAPATFRTLDITCSVGTLTGSVKNFAQVTAATQTDADSAPNNNTSTTPAEDDEAVFEIFKQGTGSTADLELVMTSLPTYKIYTNQDFTLTLRNTGGVAAQNIVVKFPFPQNFVFGGTVTSSAGTTYDTYFEKWTVPTLAAGQTVTMTITFFNLSNVDPIKAFAQVTECTTLDSDSSPNNNTTNTPVEDDEAAVTITPAAAGSAAPLSLVRRIEPQYKPIIVKKIFPMPVAEGYVSITYTSIVEKDITFEFWSQTGQLAKAETRQVAKGEQMQEFDLSELPAGMYILQISSNTLRGTPMKILKQ
jgi:large repetitive protein